MKNTFQDFTVSAPFCRKFESNAYYQKVFDFLSQDEIIIKMIEASENERPALAACCQELEAFCKNFPSSEFKFDHETKQNIGRMIKVILEPFGYIPNKSKGISDKISKQFQNASCYSIDNNAKPTLKVVKRIEEIQ